MNSLMTKKRIIRLSDREKQRLEAIRSGLKRGDKKRIAELSSVTPVWVSYVLSGEGVSEPILQAAEQLIQERKERES